MIKNSREIEAKPEGIPGDPNNPGDPIRYHMPYRMPCFQNPNCVGLQGDENCTDAYCWTQPWVNQTNKDGKAIAYFGTGSHGGDNFSFRASGYWDGEKTDCLKVARNEIFTVKRKMFVEYRYMDSQTNKDRWKNCDTCKNFCAGSHGFKTGGKLIGENYHIIADTQKLKKHLQGVFDDCFIEIDLRYTGSAGYNHAIANGENMGFNLGQKDTIYLAGVDHLEDNFWPACCNNYTGGLSVSSYSNPNHFSYVARGNFKDSKLNDFRLYFNINDVDVTNIDENCLLSASHELGHSIGSLADVQNPGANDYGLMVYGKFRHYFHSSNILFLRSQISYWDQSRY
jgi:hypothetical protein